MRAVSFGWLLLPLGLGLACGGKFTQTGESDEGNGGSSSGTPTSGGKSPGKGGSSARAGASSKGGGPAQAGQPSTCVCYDIDCNEGYQPVPTPDGCCFTCEPVGCPDLPCREPFSCPPGYHLEPAPGECCLSCILDDCAKARDDYLQYSRRVIEKYNTLPCMSDQECGLYYEKNSCNLSCGAPMPWNAFQSLDQDLQAYAKICSNCPFPDVPPCAPQAQPRCINARCQSF